MIFRRKASPAGEQACPKCGAIVPVQRRAGFAGMNQLIIGILAIVALLILGILDSRLMQSRPGGDRGGLVDPEPILSTGNLIPNDSVEQQSVEDPGRPVAWRQSKWGSNTPVFEYLDSGRTGGRSLKVTMSNLRDGDAKWIHEPVAVKAGNDYQYSDFYKSDIDTQVVVELHHEGGRRTYQALPNAPASAAWQQYATSFTVPLGVEKVVIFHLLARDGYLITDDMGLRPHTAEGFARGLVTLTFDDGWETNVETVLPRLNEENLRSVQFFATKFVEGIDDEGVRESYASGHEVGSHAVNHEDLRDLPAEQLDYELQHSKAYLESITGTPVVAFATPFGAYDSNVVDRIRASGYRLHRSVDTGFNSKNDFDVWNVRVQNVLLDTPLSEIRSWVEKASSERLWLVLVYHRVGGEPLGRYDSTEADFEQHLEILRNSGIPVVTFSEALGELLPQLE